MGQRRKKNYLYGSHPTHIATNLQNSPLVEAHFSIEAEKNLQSSKTAFTAPCSSGLRETILSSYISNKTTFVTD